MRRNRKGETLSSLFNLDTIFMRRPLTWDVEGPKMAAALMLPGWWPREAVSPATARMTGLCGHRREDSPMRAPQQMKEVSRSYRGAKAASPFASLFQLEENDS